jgi:hypothetical protein
MPLFDPLAPCFTEPGPGPSLLDQARALEAETRARAEPAMVAAWRAKRVVRLAERIVAARAEREGSRR